MLVESTEQVGVASVTPKARFIGNIGDTLVIIPDLRNAVEEFGFSLNPGDKADLLMYYTPQEINRSRGLDSMLEGIKDPRTKEIIQPPQLKILADINEELPEVAKAPSEHYPPGTALEADRNYADDNLDRLDKEEQKEEERIRARNSKK